MFQMMVVVVVMVMMMMYKFVVTFYLKYCAEKFLYIEFLCICVSEFHSSVAVKCSALHLVSSFININIYVIFLFLTNSHVQCIVH